MTEPNLYKQIAKILTDELYIENYNGEDFIVYGKAVERIEALVGSKE